jgi:hypothetical protein
MNVAPSYPALPVKARRINRQAFPAVAAAERDRTTSWPGCPSRAIMDPVAFARHNIVSHEVEYAQGIPAPRFHTVRYAGVLAPASRLRPLIVPRPPPQERTDESSAPPSSKPPTHRAGWRPWAELMKRCWAIDVETCVRCGSRMKLRKLILQPESIRRLLRFLAEPTEPPARAPARDPPFFKSRVLRRRSHEHSMPQQQMFG